MKLLSISNTRLLFSFGAIVSMAVLGSTYFMEHIVKLEPCPLCLLQRYLLWMISILWVIGSLFTLKRSWRLFYCIAIIIFSLLGLIIAGRHVWLEHYPPSFPSSCLAGLDKIFAFRSLGEILEEVFTSQECSKIDFTLLSLSLPTWSLIMFSSFTLYCTILGWLQIKRRI